MHKKAIMNSMTADDTKMFEKADCNTLHTGAITYSDAVVLAAENIDSNVLKFVKDSNKPTLAYNLTENFENFYALYEEISSEELASIA
jgi:starch synthase